MNGLEESLYETEGSRNTDNALKIKPKKANKGSGNKRKERSIARTQIDKPLMGEDGIDSTKCKYCLTTFSCHSKGGTGQLLHHMETCKKRRTRDISKMLVSSKQGSVSAADGSFDPVKFRELAAYAIAMHNLPFQFFEYENIRACFQHLRPGIQLPSRNTAKADFLRLYELHKQKIKSMLSMSPGRVSLTLDMWKAINWDGYLAVTVHFIDKDWVLRKYMLYLNCMPVPHTGVALADKIHDTLVDWGIIGKLSSLTLDDASENDSCVGYLKARLNSRKSLRLNGDLFHVHGCARVLNSIVQEALKDVDEVVEKIRESVKYVRDSQSRKENFLKCVESLGLDGKEGLRQDVPTRWDSTFLMLIAAIYLKNAFEHLGMSDPNYKSCPSMLEWERAERLCKFLGSFYDLACLFSRTKYPTSNLFFTSVLFIYMSLKRASESGDASLKRMAIGMKEKFEKYWSNINEVLAIAIVFDPRYKFHLVEFAYKRLYGNDGESRILKIRKRLFDLFDEYLHQSSCEPSSFACDRSSDLQPQERNTSLHFEESSLFSEFDSMYAIDTGVQKSELEVYLEEPRIKRTVNLDVLQFWRERQPHLPVVASMARDMLCIPISTLASESAFSCSGHIIDLFRGYIDPKTIEARICLKDWLMGEKDLAEAIMEFEELTADILSPKAKDENPSPTQGFRTIS